MIGKKNMSQAPTNQFDQQVERLIVETCQHPPDSFQRNSGLTKLIQTIIQSKKLEAEFNCSYSTLANFYKRQCRPRLRQFALTQGFLN